MPTHQHTYSAPAKINLTLDVLDRRPDGYHDLKSIFQSISIVDHITIEIDRSDVDNLSVTGEECGGVPADHTNIVMRAASRMKQLAADSGLTAPPVSIHLTKNIPSQAGLGGGSSDAAAAILSLNELLGLGLSVSNLVSIGKDLGADVPYFLYGGLCRVEGIGDRIQPLPSLGEHFIVIVKPPAGVNTGEAYRLLDAIPGRKPGSATDLWPVSHPSERLPLHNDFEGVVLEHWPQIGNAHAVASETAARHGAYEPRLCGSGACLFTLCATPEQSELIANDLTRAGIGKIWQARTITGGCIRVD